MTDLLAPLRKALDASPLDLILPAINQACRSWMQDEKPLIEPPLEGLRPKDAPFFWVAAETARQAILWSPWRSYESRIVIRDAPLSPAVLRRIMNWSANAQLDSYTRTTEHVDRIRSEPILDTVSRLFYPQFLLERATPYRVGQALLLYRDGPKRRRSRMSSFPLEDYQTVLQRTLGCDLESFVLSLMQISGASYGHNPRLGMNRMLYADRRFDGMLCHPVGKDLLCPSAVEAMRLLASDPVMARSSMVDQVEDAGSVMTDAPNPLLRHPLVRAFRDRLDHVIAPVPHLILEWLYEPLADLLYQGRSARFTAAHVSQIFEEYVGLLADESAPDGQAWTPESDLQRGYDGRVVDWARVFQDAIILFDAKRCFVSDLQRYRSRAIEWRQSEKTWADGVRQCHEFWTRLQSGAVPAIPSVRSKRCVAIIVTQGDSGFRSGQAMTCERIERDTGIAVGAGDFYWLILSLDRYELLMAAWSGQTDPDWLPAQLLRYAAESDRSAIDLLDVPAQGRLWEALERMVDNLQSVAGQDADG